MGVGCSGSGPHMCWRSTGSPVPSLACPLVPFYLTQSYTLAYHSAVIPFVKFLRFLLCPQCLAHHEALTKQMSIHICVMNEEKNGIITQHSLEAQGV